MLGLFGHSLVRMIFTDRLDTPIDVLEDDIDET